MFLRFYQNSWCQYKRCQRVVTVILMFPFYRKEYQSAIIRCVGINVFCFKSLYHLPASSIYIFSFPYKQWQWTTLRKSHSRYPLVFFLTNNPPPPSPPCRSGPKSPYPFFWGLSLFLSTSTPSSPIFYPLYRLQILPELPATADWRREQAGLRTDL